MKNRRKQGKIFRSLLAVLMLTAMLVTSVLQPVFAGDYETDPAGACLRNDVRFVLSAGRVVVDRLG